MSTATASSTPDLLSSPAGMTRADNARQAYETAVVEQAARLFLEHGVDTVKMTDIAAASGLGVATLYRNFGSKTNLAIASGILLWQRFATQTEKIAASPAFKKASGCEQLRQLFEIYLSTYREHPEFISFLDGFDHLMLTEKVESSALADYEAQVDVIYPLFETAYRAGLDDGSVSNEVDFPVFYRSAHHALMGVAQKLIRGAIVPSDANASGEDELRCIVDMSLGYLTRR